MLKAERTHGVQLGIGGGLGGSGHGDFLDNTVFIYSINTGITSISMPDQHPGV
jgi:hypothetical protein